MIDLKVGGVQSVEKVARLLKSTGNKELKKELITGITKASKPARQKVKAAAVAQLPRRGGLNRLIGKATISSSTRLSGRNPGVRIVGKRAGISVRQIDEGTIRHPVFGRDVWVTQKIKGGWFSETLEGEAPEIRREVVNVLDAVAKKLARGI